MCERQISENRVLTCVRERQISENRVMTCEREREERQISENRFFTWNLMAILVFHPPNNFYITRRQCNKQFISVWTPLALFCWDSAKKNYLMTLVGCGGGRDSFVGSLVLLKGVTATYPRVTLRTNIPDLGSMPGSVPSHPQRKKTKIKQVLAFER